MSYVQQGLISGQTGECVTTFTNHGKRHDVLVDFVRTTVNEMQCDRFGVSDVWPSVFNTVEIITELNLELEVLLISRYCIFLKQRQAG